MLSEEQVQSFHHDGYLIIQDVLSEQETRDLQRWAQEVHDWPTAEESPWMPYEVFHLVVCMRKSRAEDWIRKSTLMEGRSSAEQRIMPIPIQGSAACSADQNCWICCSSKRRSTTSSQEAVSSSSPTLVDWYAAYLEQGGFAPHIDSTAYTHIKKIKHLAILLAVDPSNSTNGGLEVVKGSHEMNVPIAADNCIEPDWVQRQTWIPVELAAGKSTCVSGSKFSLD